MHGQARCPLTDSRAYTTSTQFCTVFTDNMASLHSLSFLLTADPTKAEVSFVCGLGDCVEGSCVFRDWAQSGARRTIIQNAIRRVAPRKNHLAVTEAPSDPVSCSFGRTPEAGYTIRGILRLEDFERFVFVMSLGNTQTVIAPFCRAARGRRSRRRECERYCISLSLPGNLL